VTSNSVTLRKLLHNDRFPLSSNYDPDFEQVKVALGTNRNDDEALALAADERDALVRRTEAALACPADDHHHLKRRPRDAT